MGTKRAAVVVVVAGVLAAGVTPVAASAASAASEDPANCVSAVLGSMSLQQQVGQLFIMGVSSTAPTSQQLGLITSKSLGGVILMGHSSVGVSATKAVANTLQARATTTAGTALTVAVDQEGGEVQVLKGTGFSTMPTALTQGTESATTLRANAGTWGRQLLAAGITLNLAPVLDTVPASLGTGNKPIGYYHREFGYTTDAVTPHGMAFASGMSDARVQTSGKHFPGLGRVRDNTDTTFGVADNVTVRDDTYLRPFSTAASARITAIMISAARYNKIDGQRAVFSSTVMKGMLRGDLGFKGLIISDSMAAAAVNDLAPGTRAVDFLLDGGTVVLDTNAADITPMVDAVVAKANADTTFRSTVTENARLVLTSKYTAGLLSCPAASDPIALHYTEMGGSAAYGNPTTGEYRVAGGRARDYSRGSVVWSWRTGARAVHGSIASKYHSLGGAAGALGFPTTDEYSTSVGRTSAFEHGTISWNRTTGAITVAYS
ncbi:glycoside hydrolase family 3 N-terminal domain-containing protein [Labedaea rhizosphaerae]|nr:glycoside hydrolase family 3 N-terminal domain-containing protein [Labedaea rhizosphaerae]